MEQLYFLEETSFVPDVRTEKQVNNKVSYDVGEKIGGARKDLAARKKAFLDIPSLEALQELEDESVQAAAELVSRNTFFSWFSIESCQQKGIEAQAAKALQLLIHRIDKVPADSKQDRENYTSACLFVSEQLRNVTTLQEFQNAEWRIKRLILSEGMNKDYVTRTIKSIEEQLSYETNEKIIQSLQNHLNSKKQTLELMHKADSLNLSVLGTSFCNFFLSASSRKSAYQAIYTVDSYDDLQKKSTHRGGKKTNPVWERKLPERPDRKGGKIISISKPEEFAQMFDFRAVEFGHYVQDSIGYDHLFRAAEALTDLANILDVPNQALGLNGELSFAFGSRGRGNALGHYEPASKVINLTKKRGSLGVLAHEYFHALDHHLFSLSHDFKNGKIGYVTEGSFGFYLPATVQKAIENMVDSFTNGKSVAYLDVSNRSSYRIPMSFKSRYKALEGDLHDIMDEVMDEFDDRQDSLLRAYRSVSDSEYKSPKEKLERKRKKHLKLNAEALAQLHEEVTGEKVTKIPYTVNHTQFFQTGIDLDKGKAGKYWSSVKELGARAFEAFIFDQLQQRGWVSDYLVCGARDSVFPQGEERERINDAIRNFINVIRPLIQ